MKPNPMPSHVYDIARNSACNAVRIAECLPVEALEPGAFPSPLFDAVVESAVEMAHQESLYPIFGFWSDSSTDWESACEAIAQDLAKRKIGGTTDEERTCSIRAMVREVMDVKTQ